MGSILRRAAGEGASDIHLEPRGEELTVRFRVDGVLREVMSVPSALQGGVVARLKVLASLDIAERRLPQDGRFSATLEDGKMDLRVSTLPTTFGEKVVLRLLDNADLRTDLRGLGFSRKMLQQLRDGLPAALRDDTRYGPDGVGQVHDALRHAWRAQRHREEHRHGRGPGRVQDAGHQPGPGQSQDRAYLPLRD